MTSDPVKEGFLVQEEKPAASIRQRKIIILSRFVVFTTYLPKESYYDRHREAKYSPDGRDTSCIRLLKRQNMGGCLMNKTIDLNETVYAICSQYPETKEILARLGFRDIAKPGILNTVGKFMTIPRGASMRSIELSQVISALQAAGFTISGEERRGGTGTQAQTGCAADTCASDAEGRAALLKEYVGRLSRGDSLDAVRKDFVANFQSVDAAEIVGAEEQLIRSGTPVAEVQRLCDVHSALFHGATREEQIANAEKAVQASAQNAADAAAQTAGHPVRVFEAENAVIDILLDEVRKAMEAGAARPVILEKLNAFRAVTTHYAEKGDLLYPVLKSKYGVSGPADVMWGVDDEIRDELKMLAEAKTALPDFAERLGRLLSRAEEMIYKENNILIPLCVQNFTEEDWMHVYYELPAYDAALLGERPVWEAAEARRAARTDNAGKAGVLSASGKNEWLPLDSGHMTPAQIEAVLNTIPMELTFIDENDINRFFNAGDGKKLFKRPDAAVDREVFSCHPPKYAAMARQIIDRLKAGAQDSVDVWLTKRGEPVFIRYMAVRSRDGKYVGTLECVQKMGFAEAHFKNSL